MFKQNQKSLYQMWDNWSQLIFEYRCTIFFIFGGSGQNRPNPPEMLFLDFLLLMSHRKFHKTDMLGWMQSLNRCSLQNLDSWLAPQRHANSPASEFAIECQQHASSWTWLQQSCVRKSIWLNLIWRHLVVPWQRASSMVLVNLRMTTLFAVVSSQRLLYSWAWELCLLGINQFFWCLDFFLGGSAGCHKKDKRRARGGSRDQNTQICRVNKAWWTLSLPQTSRANPVQCYSTHSCGHVTIPLTPQKYMRDFTILYIRAQTSRDVYSCTVFMWKCVCVCCYLLEGVSSVFKLSCNIFANV